MVQREILGRLLIVDQDALPDARRRTVPDDLPPRSGTTCSSFPVALGSIRAARVAVSTAAVPLFGRGSRLTDIELAVSELATNAVEHGTGSMFAVSTFTTPEQFIVEVVSDGAREPSAISSPTPDQPTGRGLHIASSVADSLRIVSDDRTVRVICAFTRPELPTT